MLRTLESRLDIRNDRRQDTRFAFLIAAAEQYSPTTETLRILADGEPVEPAIAVDVDGSRAIRLSSAAERIEIDYRAEIAGLAEPLVPRDVDPMIYTRPSRYAESDLLGPAVRAEFGRMRDWPLVDAVVDWVHSRIAYLPGSSDHTDGARDTFLHRKGVCRDFAHLVIAILRAHDQPARFVAVYAPQLRPMDFHAVVEVLVDGEWWLVDATRLAPRERMVRIATGRDAADVAFMSNTLSGARLRTVRTGATTDIEVGDPDHGARVRLR
ncbi:MAG: transglutaminase family protein [Microbacteriaceae bacterium]|nr:transglutaminase family protein [Microbacteriaceae bacterium]